MTAPETKRLYNHSDLTSLVAGDRVKLDYDSDEEHDTSNLAVYMGIKKGRITFLTISSYEGKPLLAKEEVAIEDLSFDEDGTLVADDVEPINAYDYEQVTSPQNQRRYAKILNLLRQAGLYHG